MESDESGTESDDLHEQFGTGIAHGTRVPLSSAVTPSTERRVIEREHDFSSDPAQA